MGNRFFFDTNPIIYYLEAHLEYASKVKSFLIRNKVHGCSFFTSTISSAEFLCKPIANHEIYKIEQYHNFISDFEFYIFDITESIAYRSAQLRAKYKGLKLPDALQLATAIEHHCDAFLTNDERLIQVTEAHVLYLRNL